MAAALLLVLAGPNAKTAKDVALPVQTPRVAVIVAAHALLLGSVVGAADIRTKTIPGMAPAGAVSDGAIGRIVKRRVGAGEVLLRDSLRDPEEVGIAARIPQGDRAFSIRVAEDEIVGGFLQSGDHVDVFATIPGSAFAARDAQNLADRSQTVLLLQNVLVLAVGENAATRGSIQTQARTVSLSLPPKELARLALALRYGKVSLAIRETGDTQMVDAATASLADLVKLPVQEPQPQPSSAPARHGAGIPLYAGTRTTVARWSGAP